MTGNDLIKRLQSFSPEELDQEVYICGDDCLVNSTSSIYIQQEDYIDEDEREIPAGSIVIEW